MHDTPYNGWPNYETWAYALWMDNCEVSYNAVRNAALKVVRGELDRYAAIDSLKEDMETMVYDLLDQQPEPSVLNDLLISAMQSINFHHYFDNVLEEVKDQANAPDPADMADTGESEPYYPKDENRYWEDK